MSIQREIKQTRPFAAKTQEAAVALLRTADLVRRTLTAVLEPHDITLQQFNVLRILRGAGTAGLPTLEIAERMIEAAPGITRLIDRLETKGLVRRERCAKDRRQVFCHITDAGLELLKNVDALMLRTEEEALSTLSEHQLAQLNALLEKARNGLHATLTARRADETQEVSKG